MFLFLTTVVKNTTKRNSFWDFPLQLLYTQAGMAGQWCLEFPWGCGRFLYPIVSSIRSSLFFFILSPGWVGGKSSWNLRKMLTVSVIFILCLLKPITVLLLPFPFPVWDFPNCCMQTYFCLESILPSPKRRCCFKQRAGSGRWVLLLTLKYARQA